MKTALIVFLILEANIAFSQRCPDGCYSKVFYQNQVTIYICVENKVNPLLGIQHVYYGVKNNTSDELYIKFTKVITTTCGDILKESADTHLNPQEFVGSGAFSGEGTFDFQLWSKDCNRNDDRVNNATFEGLKIQNISKEERDRVAKEEKEKELDKKRQDSIESIKAAAAAEKKKNESKTEKDQKQTNNNAYYDPRAAQNVQNQLAQNAAMTSALATTQSAMAVAMLASTGDETYDYTYSSYLKLNIGFGYQDLPVNANVTDNSSAYYNTPTKYYSTSTTTNNLFIQTYLTLALLNDKFVNLRLSPFFTWGNNAFTGSVGEQMTYGAGANLGFGKRFRFQINGAFVGRSGNLSQDSYPAFDEVSLSNYSYHTLKYGLGLYYGLNVQGSYIQAGFYKEIVSFLANTNAQVYSADLRIALGIIYLDIEYAINYPIAGDNTYPTSYQIAKQNNAMISISVPITIFKK
jgi:hypothetical protein